MGRWRTAGRSAPSGESDAFGVVRHSLPVDDNAGLVTDDPGVVSRRADHEVSRSEPGFFAAVHDDLHAPGEEVPHVGRLAAGGAGDGLDVLGPLPPRLEGRPSDGTALEVDQLELPGARLERTHFLG